MSIALDPRSTLARFGRPLAATALALAASASLAATSSVNVDAFIITIDGGVPSVTQKYAWASSPAGTLNSTAQEGAGAGDSASLMADSWNQSLPVVAQTTSGYAFGEIVGFTDAMTQLQTPGFNLIAMASQSNDGPLPANNTGNSAGQLSGSFTLIDEFGEGIGGFVTFEIFYSLAVSNTVGMAPNDLATASISFTANDSEGNGSFSDSLSSATAPGGVGSVVQMRREIIFNLTPGELASFTLGGTAYASASPVPEPTPFALGTAGLLAIAGIVRRRRRAAAEAA